MSQNTTPTGPDGSPSPESENEESEPGSTAPASQSASVGIIGGSGLYELDGLSDIEELAIETPFGEPSDTIIRGELEGRTVCFLPRHGRGHRILPHELNHRANIWALRSLEVRWIISVSAVGSLQDDYKPRDVLLPNQFFDRTSRRSEHTFFGRGIAAHVAFADPLSAELRQLIYDAAIQDKTLTVHNSGTYVNMDGPAFSTRAESEANRQLGFDVIGMTNLPEAKLAREAEIALATMALITDYDCWKTDAAPVTAAEVMETMAANTRSARKILSRVIPRIPQTADSPEHRALDTAIMTPRERWPEETVDRLRPLLSRLL